MLVVSDSVTIPFWVGRSGWGPRFTAEVSILLLLLFSCPFSCESQSRTNAISTGCGCGLDGLEVGRSLSLWIIQHPFFFFLFFLLPLQGCALPLCSLCKPLQQKIPWERLYIVSPAFLPSLPAHTQLLIRDTNGARDINPSFTELHFSCDVVVTKVKVRCLDWGCMKWQKSCSSRMICQAVRQQCVVSFYNHISSLILQSHKLLPGH